jgi:hypothetical protein
MTPKANPNFKIILKPTIYLKCNPSSYVKILGGKIKILSLRILRHIHPGVDRS